MACRIVPLLDHGRISDIQSQISEFDRPFLVDRDNIGKHQRCLLADLHHTVQNCRDCFLRRICFWGVLILREKQTGEPADQNNADGFVGEILRRADGGKRSRDTILTSAPMFGEIGAIFCCSRSYLSVVVVALLPRTLWLGELRPCYGYWKICPLVIQDVKAMSGQCQQNWSPLRLKAEKGTLLLSASGRCRSFSNAKLGGNFVKVASSWPSPSSMRTDLNCTVVVSAGGEFCGLSVTVPLKLIGSSVATAALAQWSL